MGSKNKSVSSSEKSQDGKNKAKKDKKEYGDKKEVNVFINEEEAGKIIKSSKAITIQDLARQANVKISTANAFLKKALIKGTVRKIGGFSGHYIYQPVTQ
jgi:small subunit ribosomal protein S25e